MRGSGAPVGAHRSRQQQGDFGFDAVLLGGNAVFQPDGQPTQASETIRHGRRQRERSIRSRSQPEPTDPEATLRILALQDDAGQVEGTSASTRAEAAIQLGLRLELQSGEPCPQAAGLGRNDPGRARGAASRRRQRLGWGP